MKKISTLFLIVLCICVAAVFVSCGDHTHAWDEGTVTTEATCMYTGTVLYKCECGKTKVATIDKLAHDFDTVISYDNAYHYYACKADKCTATKDLTAHDWVKDNSATVAPTCNSQGSATYNCACGAKKTENIAQIKEHVWNTGVVTTAATCQKNGVKTYTCTICSDTYTEELVADHVFAEGVNWSSNETHHYYACTTPECEAIKEESSAEHTWEAGVVTLEPTCMAAGVRTYTCSVCKATKTEEIAMLSHVFSDKYQSNASYHYHYCTKAGCNATDEKIAHTWDAGAVTTEPTPTADGVRTFTCSICFETKTQVELYHEYSEWSYDENKHYKKCTLRGHEDISEEGKHVWDDGVITEYPTPTTYGEIIYSCECGCKDVRPIIYTEELDSNFVNSTAWDAAFAEENFKNITLSGKWYVDAKNYYNFAVKLAGGMCCVEISVGNDVNKLLFFTENGDNYVGIYDSYTLSWEKREIDFTYTYEYFYKLLAADGKFFDFVFNVKRDAYTAGNITLGETKYTDIAYVFENGELSSVSAKLDGVVNFIGEEFVGFELDFSNFGTTVVELPIFPEPAPAPVE
ncbi:MAG: hypothetical protein IJW38_00190 [Clostridia bacterium]|nr:hypothetical protein [Clostridia bacterium]